MGVSLKHRLCTALLFAMVASFSTAKKCFQVAVHATVCSVLCHMPRNVGICQGRLNSEIESQINLFPPKLFMSVMWL